MFIHSLHTLYLLINYAYILTYYTFLFFILFFATVTEATLYNFKLFILIYVVYREIFSRIPFVELYEFIILIIFFKFHKSNIIPNFLLKQFFL